MSSQTGFLAARKPARTVFVLLAVIALFALLARPICDLSRFQDAASHDGVHPLAGYSAEDPSQHDGSEPCCASVEDGSLAVPATAGTVDAKSWPGMLPAISGSAWAAKRRSVLGPTIPPDRPPISRLYHARSARILI